MLSVILVPFVGSRSGNTSVSFGVSVSFLKWLMVKFYLDVKLTLLTIFKNNIHVFISRILLITLTDNWINIISFEVKLYQLSYYLL